MLHRKNGCVTKGKKNKRSSLLRAFNATKDYRSLYESKRQPQEAIVVTSNIDATLLNTTEIVPMGLKSNFFPGILLSGDLETNNPPQPTSTRGL